jgi:hypothetical protein
VEENLSKESFFKEIDCMKNMKSLKNLLIALPIILCTNCTWLNNLINPPTPAPIVSNINHPPVTNLSIEPLSGYSPLTTSISLTGTDDDGDEIMGYKVMIDRDSNTEGYDEEISQSTPINLERTFNDIGNVRIYGQCKDEHGLNSNRTNTKIIISEEKTNKLPIAELLVNPTKGQYPLTTNISLTGTDEEDGTIGKYKLEIDIGQDGTIDETIPTEGGFSNEPISIERTFNDIGNVIIYGVVKDNEGGEMRTGVNVYVSERNDLTGNISFEESYRVGDNFFFSGIVQNNSGEDIVIDNSGKDSLEYKLLKEGIATPFLNQKVEENARINLLSPNGYIKLDYKNNEVVISNADVTYSDLPEVTWNLITLWGWADENNEYHQSIPNMEYYSFTESGRYSLETMVKYSINGSEYNQKFVSPTFIVGDK